MSSITFTLDDHVSGSATYTPLTGAATFSNFTQFLTYRPPTKRGEAMIWPSGAGGNTYTNIAPGGITADPSNAGQFLLYVGEFEGNVRVNSRIRAYSGYDSDPLGALTDKGLVLTKGTAGAFDDEGVSFGNAINVGGTIYLYYGAVASTGTPPNGSETIGLATSTDGITFTKQGQVVTPNGVNEFNLTDPTVYHESGNWYMYVTGKSGGGGGPLPDLGIICYTSSDGLAWTRQGNVLPLGGTRDFDGKYIEGATFLKAGTDRVLLYTTSSNGNIWSLGAAVNTSSFTTAFTAEAMPWFEHSDNYPDFNGVAVPLIYNSPGTNDWFLFYQGSNEVQPASNWGLFGARLISPPPDFPAGVLSGKGSWTGEQGFFDIYGQKNIGGSNRSIRALPNVGFASTYVDHPIDVTPSSTSSIIFRINLTAISGVSFYAGIYIKEGSTVITAMYVNDSRLKYLAPGDVWTNIQLISANQSYFIEIVLTSASTLTFKVDGSAILTGVACRNNVSTKADNIRLEKATATTATIYFSDFIEVDSGVQTILDYGQ